MILAANRCADRSPNFYVASSISEVSDILNPRLGDVALLFEDNAFQAWRLVSTESEDDGYEVISSNACEYKWVLSSLPIINIASFGADDTFTEDVTSIFQMAINALPSNGGVLFLPRTRVAYKLGEVSITRPNVTIIGSGNSTVLKRGAGLSGATGGIFVVDAMHDAYFTLQSVAGDLNRSEFTNGTLNSLVFTRRSSHVYIHDVSISNSSENGIKIRNSAWVEVDHITVDNCWNIGVEFNFTLNDGYAGPVAVPEREHYWVTRSTFTNIDDGLLGSGDSSGIIAGANNTILGVTIKEFKFNGNTFRDNVRDIWMECANDIHFRNFQICQNETDGCLQVSMGCIGGKNGVFRGNIIRNVGTEAPRVAGNSVAGIYLGGGSGNNAEQISLIDNHILDERNSAADYCVRGIEIAKGDRITISLNEVVAGSDAAIYIQSVTGTLILTSNNCVGVSVPAAQNGIKFGAGMVASVTSDGNNVVNFVNEWVNPPTTATEGIMLGNLYVRGNVNIGDNGTVGPAADGGSLFLRGGEFVDSVTSGSYSIISSNTAAAGIRGRMKHVAGNPAAPAGGDGEHVWTTLDIDRWKIDRDGAIVAELGGTFIEFVEIANPALPASNRARLFLRDDGSGKSQLCIRYQSGSIGVIDTEP